LHCGGYPTYKKLYINKRKLNPDTKSKNICLITESTDNLIVLSLAKALSAFNCNVDVIAFNHTRKDLQLDNLEFGLHIIQNNKHRPCTKKVGRIAKYLKSRKNAKHLQNEITKIGKKFDLIVSNMYLAHITSRKLNMPHTYFCIHSTPSAVIEDHCNHTSRILNLLKKQMYLVLIRRLYKNQNLITVSQGIKQDILNLGVRAKTIQTIYNPLDFGEIQKKADAFPVEEEDYIIHVGRFSKEKRHDVLINAYKQSGIQKKLLLLGNEKTEVGVQVKQLVKNLELQDRVVFKGFQANPFPYIKNAKMMVLSSDHEGFGMVLVEAISLNTPVISTNCIGPSEILCDKLSYCLSPVGDHGALAENMRKAIEKPIRLESKHLEKYNARASAKQYFNLCD